MMKRRAELGVRTQIWILVLTSTGYVTLGRSLPLSKPHFLPYKIEGTCFSGLAEVLCDRDVKGFLKPLRAHHVLD